MSARESRPGEEAAPEDPAADQLQRNGHNGHEPSRLRAALESGGGSLKSLTVLAPQNDPFRVDTDAGHRDGAWLASAEQAVDEQAAEHREQIHDDVMPVLEEKRDEIQRILDGIPELLDTVRIDANMFDLPPIPAVPEPVIDHDHHPEPLCDSRWSFPEQCRRLIASKNYQNGEMW